VNPHFLAISLTLTAACILWMTGVAAGTGLRRRDLQMAASAVIAGLLLAAIFVNAAVDLW
jgi:heme/copper-type cytochrome/quinol oxidase subunit 3